MNITLSKEELKNLLLLSFENGYEGYLDTKEDCVNFLLNNFLENKNDKNTKISLSSSDFYTCYTNDMNLHYLPNAYDAANYSNITLTTTY